MGRCGLLEEEDEEEQEDWVEEKEEEESLSFCYGLVHDTPSDWCFDEALLR